MVENAPPHGRVSSLAVLLLGPATALFAVVETWRVGEVPQPAGTVLGAAAGLALVVRRRMPLACYLVGMAALVGLSLLDPAFGDSSAAFVLLFFLLPYALGRWAIGLQRVLGLPCVLGASVFFLAGELAKSDGPDRITADALVFGTAYCAGPWLAGLAIGGLVTRNDHLRGEQAELAARAVIEERARIARELHDVVSHAISVTVLQARGARRSLDADPEAVREALDAIEHTNAQALGDMRRLLAVLRDTEGDASTAPQPSLAHLGELLESVRDAGVEVELVERGTRRDVPPGVDLSAYRIIQESLTNVLRHAAGSQARVLVEHGEDALRVEVVNGPGRQPSRPGSGHGLVGVRERVAVVGGQVEAGPVPGGGYRLSVRLPHAVEVA